jgi:hypothetical protein
MSSTPWTIGGTGSQNEQNQGQESKSDLHVLAIDLLGVKE